MKKIIALTVVLCLLFAGGIAYLRNPVSTSINEEAEVTENAAEAVAEDSSELIYKEIYSKYDPDTVVMTVNGKDVTWGEYFYWFYNYAGQVEQMMLYYPLYYGVDVSWDDIYDPNTGVTYYDLPADTAESQLKTFVAINEYAENAGIEFSEESEAEYQNTIDTSVQEAGLASEEELFESLKEIYVTKEVFDNQVKSSIFAEQCYKDLYGEGACEVADEDAIAYLQDNNYLNVMHILFLKTDAETGEELDEETYAEKIAVADEICEQINKLETAEEKIEAFKALQEQYNEDGGTQYQFTSGEMVQSFEDKSAELGEYEIGIVESEYGTHIILKLPVDPDYTIYSLSQTAREVFADNEMNSALAEIINNCVIEYKNNFEKPDLRKYF